MTREQAQKLIDSYCDDPPQNEELAIQRLIRYPVDYFDDVNLPDRGSLQDELDRIIYNIS